MSHTVLEAEILNLALFGSIDNQSLQNECRAMWTWMNLHETVAKKREEETVIHKTNKEKASLLPIASQTLSILAFQTQVGPRYNTFMKKSTSP